MIREEIRIGMIFPGGGCVKSASLANNERLRSLFGIFPRWNSRVRSLDDNEELLDDKLV